MNQTLDDPPFDRSSDVGVACAPVPLRVKRIEVSWLVALVALATGFCMVTAVDLLSASVLLSGTACVGLIALGRKEGYLVGLYNSIAYAWIAQQNGLYGEVALNLAFYLPTGVLGYVLWNRRTRDRVVIMRALTWGRRAWVVAACAGSTTALGWLLALNPAQNTPYIDASTNVLSVIATFLMMWRYKEQWLLYILLNAISIVMWVVRWQNQGVAGDAMVVMWCLFLINSVFGYWRWSLGARAARVEVGR